MQIFSEEPTNWMNLQNKVGLVFKEMGCNVIVEKTIQLLKTFLTGAIPI